MTKPETKLIPRTSRDALKLLAQIVRRGRIERRLTTQELADRAGISRGLVQRIERGDPGCAIGAVFETAAIVGVRLFDADQANDGYSSVREQCHARLAAQISASLGKGEG
jgi:transcriptional regulator with XRE-family HTH domain